MERVTLVWTRPDGQEAVRVEFTYETPERASDKVADALDVLAPSGGFTGRDLREREGI